MSENLKVTIDLDSTSAQKSIKQLDSELKSLDKQIKNIDTNTDDYNKNLDGMSKKIQLTDKKVEDLTSKLTKQNTQLQKAEERLKKAKQAQQELGDKTSDNAEKWEKTNRELNNAQSNYDKLAQNVRETQSNLSRTTDELENLNREMARMPFDNLANGLDNWSNKFQTVSDATKPLSIAVAGIGGASIKTAMSFESAMAQVQAVSGATGKDFENLSEKARQIGSETSLSASEGAEALLVLAQAGISTEDSIKMVDDTVALAVATNMDLASATSIVTNTLSAYKLNAEEASFVTDVLAQSASSSNTNVAELGEAFKVVSPVMGSLGFTVDDTATALSVLANNAIVGSSAGTALRSILAKLVSPTAEAQKSMEKYGISLKNTDGSMKSLDDVMANLRKSFSTLDEAQQAELATTLSGQEGMSALLALVNTSEDDYNSMASAIDGANGKTKEMQETMANTSEGGLKELMSKLEEMAIQIGEKLLPTFNNIIDKVGEAVDWFNQLDEGTQDNIIKFGLLVGAISPVTGALSKLLSFGSSTTSMMGTLASKLVGVGSVSSAMTTTATGVATAVGTTGGATGIIGSLGAMATAFAPWLIGGAVVLGVAGGTALIINKYKELEEQQRLNALKADESQWLISESNNALYKNFNETYQAMAQEMETFRVDGVELLNGAFEKTPEECDKDLEILKTNVATKTAEIKTQIQTDTDEMYNILRGMNQNNYLDTTLTNEQIQKGYDYHYDKLTGQVTDAETRLNEIIEKGKLVGQTIIDENGQEILYTEEQWQDEVTRAYETYCREALSAESGFTDERLQLKKSFKNYYEILDKETYEQAKTDANKAYDEQIGIVNDRYTERLATIAQFSDEELKAMGTSRDEQLEIAKNLKELEVAEAEQMKIDTLKEYNELAFESGAIDKQQYETTKKYWDDKARKVGEKVAEINKEIDKIKSKSVEIDVNFTTKGYSQAVARMKTITAQGGGIESPSISVKDYTPYTINFGNDFNALDLYGFKDSGIRTLSLNELGMDSISAYATNDGIATGTISNAIYNYNSGVMASPKGSDLGAKLDTLIGMMGEFMGRPQVENLVGEINVQDTRSIDQILKEINTYLHIHKQRF